MSTESDSKQPETGENEELLNDLPEVYNGWVRHDSDGNGQCVAYWKARSTHCNGSYTELKAAETGDYKHTNQTEVSLIETVYNQFGHSVVSRSITRWTITDSDRIRETAAGRMEAFPGEGEFESPPEMPVAIGEWELTKNEFDEVRWERDFGKAELIVEMSELDNQFYGRDKYKYAIRYRDVDAFSEGVEIVTGIPHAQAFEIAVHTLRHLDAPVSERQAAQKEMQNIKGIGPAKAKQFMLLGIGSVADLHDFIDAAVVGETYLNYHHDEAVKPILTSEIRDSIHRDLR